MAVDIYKYEAGFDIIINYINDYIIYTYLQYNIYIYNLYYILLLFDNASFFARVCHVISRWRALLSTIRLFTAFISFHKIYENNCCVERSKANLVSCDFYSIPK